MNVHLGKNFLKHLFIHFIIYINKYIHGCNWNFKSCQRKHRDYITPITYGKFAINLFFYLTIMKKLNMKKFMQLLKKAKGTTKGKTKK